MDADIAARLQGSPRRFSLLRAGVSLGVFLCVFALVCAGLDRIFARVPFLGLGDLDTYVVKVREYLDRKDEVELLFIGTSRTFRQVDARRIDAFLARKGLQVQSYNLGIPGTTLPEAVHTLDHILTEQPSALRWVVLEPNQGLDPPPEVQNVSAQRVIRWHDAATTRAVVETVWRSSASVSEKWEKSLEHVRSFAYQGSNIGMGPLFVASELRGEPRRMQIYRMVQGYLPLELDNNPAFADDLARRRKEYLDHPDLHAERIENLRAAPRSQRSPQVEHYLAALDERLAERGIGLLLFLPPPSPDRNAAFVAAAEAGIVDGLLDFNDPDRHPEFFRPEYMHDIGHLNLRGANLLTERLAVALVPILAASDGELGK